MKFCITLSNRTPRGPLRGHPMLVGAAVALAVVAGVTFPASRLCADLSGTDGLLRISSAYVMPKGGWSVGLFGQYYERKAPNASSVRERYALGNLSGRYGFTDLLEAYVVLPGEGTEWTFKALPGRDERTENHGGPGDVRIGVKLRAPFESEKFMLAAMGGVTFPSGKGDVITMPGTATGEKLFTTGETNAFARICATFDLSEVGVLSPLKVHLNAGYWLNRDKSAVRYASYMFPIPGRLENKDLILAGLGLEFPSSVVTLFTELYTEQFVDGRDLAAFKESPILVTPGARVKLPFGILATAALDLRLSSDDDGTAFDPESVLPDWAFTLGFDFVPALFAGDMDKDGIKDDVDLCPTEPEDFDGFEDADGCPDPDNDQDGILDVADKCPNQPENFNGYQDTDGCPEPDADNDGVIDALDKCPNEPEDRDGFQDDDGCPDPDNDGDGIPDITDKCPNEPETVNGYMDDDGCPDQVPQMQQAPVDSDKDGIPDSKDKCPTLAEDIDGYQDADGCPDIDNDLDGIPDAEDKCPNEPGPAENNGCPAGAASGTGHR